MKLNIIYIFGFLLFFSCVMPKENQSDEKQYILLISLDGFSSNYAEKFNAKHLLSFAKKGVQAKGLIPPYPSKTFSSHYTIATGLYPENHGIVDNSFYAPEFDEYYTVRNRGAVSNGKWYGGTPIWSLAEKNNIKTAAYYWIGSEAEIDGYRPSYYYNYDKSTSIIDRMNQAINWLSLPEIDRPQFISMYFSLVDDKGHNFGPNSPETKNAVLKIDNAIGALIKRIDEIDLPINIIIVSDHGMYLLDQSDKVIFEDIIDWSEIKHIPRDAFTMIYTKNVKETDSLYAVLKDKEQGKFTVYKKEDIPNHLHFKNNSRIGDLLMIVDPPFFFGSDTDSEYWGSHGFDPYNNKEMYGIFYASGPALKSEQQIPAFESIHIYPLLAKVLNLPYDTTSIDGKKNILFPILK